MESGKAFWSKGPPDRHHHRSYPPSLRSWDLLGLILQPVFGFFYIYNIFTHSTGAFSMIMIGARAWEMILMVGLLSILFLWVIVYILERRRSLLGASDRLNVRWLLRIMAVVAGVAAFILVQPSWLGTVFSTDAPASSNPLGGMPLKYFALFVMAAIGAAILMTDIILLTSEAKEGQWGYLSRGSIITAFAAGILGTSIVAVIGFVRESARAPWTMYGIIPVSGWQNSVVPIPLPQIVLAWLGVLLLSWTIFWFVAKVTAYHPSEEDGL